MDEVIDAAGTRHERARGEVRIVSLVPSLTELLFALQLGGSVVGRSGFCVHPQPTIRAIPKVGGTKDVNLDRVRALRPTHLIVNVDENRKETIDALRDCVPSIIVTHPLVCDDNLALYRLFGFVFDRMALAHTLCTAYSRNKDALLAAAAAWPRQATLYLIWREPWLTVARTTYIASMLALAGWQTVPEVCAVRYPEVTTEDWSAADIVLLASEPYRFRRRDIVAVRARAGSRAAAVLVDGEMISWYGSRAIEGLRYLRELRERLETQA